FSNFCGVLSTLTRYAIARTRYSRGRDVGAGNALIASALLSLRERNVPVWVNARMVSLVGDASTGVLGAVIERDCKLIRIQARRGVILTSSGFRRNPRLIKELAKDFPHDQTVAAEENMGDALEEARRIGAAVDTDLVTPCWWTPTSKYREPNGTESTILYGYLDRSRPGMIAVNAAGKRFVNDSDSYHDIVYGMFKDGVNEHSRFYLICDRRFVWKRGFGNMIKPYQPFLGRYVRSGYVARGRTIRELASQIG